MKAQPAPGRFVAVGGPRLLAHCLLLLVASGALAQKGLAVLSVVPRSGGEQAGISPGDLLTGWRTTPSKTGDSEAAPLRSPLGLAAVEVAHGPGGGVVLVGERDGDSREWSLSARSWGIRARPGLSERALRGYDRAIGSFAAGQVDAGVASLRELATNVESPDQAAGLLLEAARELAAVDRAEDAGPVFEEALARLRGSPRPLVAALYREFGGILARLSRHRAAVVAFEHALAAWEELGNEPLGVAVARLDLAEAVLLLGDLDRAEGELERAAAAVRELAPASELGAVLLSRLGKIQLERGTLDRAEDLLREALDCFARVAPRGLGVATAHDDLGILLRKRGELDESESQHLLALRIRQELDPEGLTVAQTLNGLGILVYRRGELDLSESYHRRALEIRQRLAPGGLDVSKSLVNLGGVSHVRGDLAATQDYFERALEIRRRLAPRSLIVANSLHNLGVVYHSRGDLPAAEAAYRAALAIEERVAPRSVDAAQTLSDLGSLLLDRRDVAAGEALLRRAVELHQELTPGGPFAKDALVNLASAVEARGDDAGAMELTRRALALGVRMAPDGLQTAVEHQHLGRLALERGDLELAQREIERAFEIRRAKVPDGLDLAKSYSALADLASAHGELETAREHHLQALEIRQRLSPGTFYEAETLQALGRIAEQLGKTEEAIGWLERAVDAVGTVMERMGGRQLARAEFMAHHLPAYHRLVGLLITSDRATQAFHVVERSRARTLLALLAERDLDLKGILPEPLERERRALELELDRFQARISSLHPRDDRAEIETLLERQLDLHNRQALLRDEIRRSSPQLAALRYPQPLDLDAARATLTDGCVLFSYLVAHEASWLFVIMPPSVPGSGLSVYRLDHGAEELGRRVSILRSLIERGGEEGRVEDAYVERARWLFDELIGPAGELYAEAARIVISPDGPLHALPFSALVTIDQGGRPVYLAEQKAIHKVASATLYAELQEVGSSVRPPPLRLVAFGDPALSQPGAGTDDSLRDAQLSILSEQRGFRLGALPYSRSEVKALGDLYGSSAKIFLGADATEEAAKVMARRAQILHFACHSVLDEEAPMSSALVLSRDTADAPGRDNGLLQAWEIFERVRLHADLVTLSACQTALGKEVSGEGLMGLARAFQFAGARSVVASLWSVSDRSTTELMRKFYSGLIAGRSKDEALRAAQLHLIRGGAGKSAATPFHWAAFELYGAWR